MYNRYIPDSNGIYERHSVPEPESKEHFAPPLLLQEASKSCEKRHIDDNNRFGMDLGDLLLLCIVLLLLIDSDGDDKLPLLIMAAAFVFLQ